MLSPMRAAVGGGALVVIAMLAAMVLSMRGSAAPSPAAVGVEPEAALGSFASASAAPQVQPPGGEVQRAGEPEPTRATAVQEARAPKQVVSTHAVGEGETLRSIAANYGVSMETLVTANGLREPDRLQPGQELLVPTVDGVLHTVVAGDTLRRIAERYEVELSEIVAANELPAPDVLPVGTVLVVPGARVAPVVAQSEAATVSAAGAPSAPAVAAADPQSDAGQAIARPSTYTVREGDTLRSIAQGFGLDILSLVAINGLANPDLITPGRTLRVSANDTLEHVVRPGETLANIAWSYQIASSALLEANGVRNPDHIASGSVLIVPGGRPRGEASDAPAQAAPATSARGTSAGEGQGTAPKPQAQAAAPKPEAAAPASKPAAEAPAPKPAAAAPAPKPAAAAPVPQPAVNERGERVITAKVTGYAIGAGAVSNRTASGTQTHWGTVAADTRLYPFGTKVKIEGFGDMVFTVEDTGSAVRGNIFDIWFPDAASARRLGATTRQVTVLP